MDDLISRTQAIEALEKAIRNDPYYDSNERINGLGVCDVRVILNDLPSAQPESEERKAESAQNVPIEDLISRKAAIEVIEEMQMPIMRSMFPEEQFVFKGMSEALNAIKDLPSAQSEPQWIPCSERMPEKYGNYLISIHGEDEPDIGTINPNDKRGWSLCDANGFYWASDKELIVTAWMPLPEPYRAERRTDE